MRICTRREVVLFSALAIFLTTTIIASASAPALETRNSGNRVLWTAHVPYESATLTVAIPGGTVVERTFTPQDSISFSPDEIEGLAVIDGSYSWQIVLSPVLTSATREKMKAARALGDSDAIDALVARREIPAEDELIHSGTFRVANLSLVADAAIEPGAQTVQLKASGGVVDSDDPTRDQVIVDDLIVDGSACVGFDCVNGENFGFDTIRMKENNIRLHFDDTSNSASFPSNDWRIVANDTSNGGAAYLAIEDATAGRQVFRVTAGAPANSLFVDAAGDVGLGTSNPVLEFHVADGDSPGLRLEQNGSSGFTPQTWDIAGNETNFFVRDVTNGSRLPFKIRPGAPDNSIYINTNGNIGIGTASPGFVMHAVRSGANVAYVAQRSAGATAFMNATASFGQFGTTTDHPLRLLVNTDTKMTLNADDSLTMASGATCSAGGAWLNASSRELKDDVRSLSAGEAHEVLDGLEPVHFRYKNDESEDNVGFIAEDVPDMVATKDRKSLSSMDIVAVLTKVVQDQQSTIDRLEERLARIEGGLEE